MYDAIPEIISVVTDCKQKLGINTNIHISFNSRFTRRLGDASYRKDFDLGTIRLSRKLWDRATDEERLNTIVHEFCHIAKAILYPCTKGFHNSYWKYLHRKCGYQPNTTHKIDRTGLEKKQERILGFCGCSSHPLTKNKVTRMRKGQMYRCVRCRNIVGLSKETFQLLNRS
jgi:SprT protein